MPKVPKDRLLGELLKKHEDLIWKYHDHDSLLENQTDENLSEEERKAAWEEFENEKRGFANFGNPMLQQQVMSNINPQYIQSQYRQQYPELTEEQVVAATRAYIQQLQTPFTRKPAYDKSHYQQEMARAKLQERQLYPGTFGSTRNDGADATPSTSRGTSASAWQDQILTQQRIYQQRQLMAAKEKQRQQQQEPITISDDDDDAPEEITLDGDPVTKV